MSRLTFAALASVLVSAPAVAQGVPARDLLEFPLGLLADAPALSTRMPASLWNPASRSADSSARAEIGLAGLTTPQNQGAQLGMIGGEYRIRPGLSAALSFAQASVSDIIHTETDPQSIGGEIPYGTSLLSAGLAMTRQHSSFGMWSAGLAARYRWATVDQDHGGAFSLDGGVIVDRILGTPLRGAASTFLSQRSVVEKRRRSWRQSTRRCCVGTRTIVRAGYSASVTQSRGRDDYVFTSVDYRWFNATGGFDWSTAFGDQDRRLRLGHRSSLRGLRRGGQPRRGFGGPRRELSIPRDPDDSMTTAPANPPSESRVNLLNLSPSAAQAQLAAFLERAGEPKYRAAQIARRLWLNPAPSFEQMTELPKALRESLAASFDLPRLEIAARQKSSDGTEKFLFRLADGEAIESVAIPEGDRVTLCISSQAGCALQCAFCATGAMGFSRNLSTFEIAGQVREMRLLDPPIDITNVVFMGMGEPLMNWKAVDGALTVLNDPAGLGIGARHITISTVGILPGIVALGERPEQFRLAISIHAPSDSLAARADADQHQVSARRRDSRREGVRPARDVRVRDARRRERRSRARDPTRGARARMPRLRQSDSAASRRRARLHPDERRRHSPSSRASCATRTSRWR